MAYRVGGGVDTLVGSLGNASGVLSLKADGTRDVQVGSNSYPTALFVEGSNGRVGMGTASPDYALDVRSSGATTLQVKSANNSDDTQLRLQSKNFFFNITNEGASGNITYISDDAQDQIWYTDNASNSSAERFRIKGGADTSDVVFSNSKVGIGCTPSAKLHINNGSSAGAGAVYPIRLSGGNELSTAGDSTGIQFVQRNQHNDYGGYVRLTNTASTPSYLNPRLEFGVQNNNTNALGSVSTKMVLDGNGRCGIGTTSPTARLNVKSSGSTVDQIAVTHSGNTVKIVQIGQSTTNSGNGAIALKNNSGVDKVYLDAAGSSYFMGGSLGIGTTSPSTKLHVNGGSKFLGGGDWTNIERVTNTESYYSLYVTNTGTNANQAIARFSHSAAAGNAGSGAETAVIARDKSYFYSKLGVGLNDPSAKLHIKDANPVIKLEDSDPDGVYGQIDAAGGDFIIAADGGAGSANSFISFRVDGTASSAEKARITSTGLGIGTAIPSHKLTVKGDVCIEGIGGNPQHGVLRFRRAGTTYDFAYIGFENPALANDEFLISAAGNGNPIKLQSGANTSMNFYIGTTHMLALTTSALYPPSNGTKDLGLSGNRWNNFYSEAGNFSGVIVAGSTSTNGGSWLEKNYSTDSNGAHKINVLSSHYSSGNTIIGYGVAGKSGSNGYVATYGNFSGGKAALEVANNAFYFKVADSAAQHSIGDDVTLTTRLAVDKNALTYTSSNGSGLIVNRTSATAKLQLFPSYSNVPTIMGKGAGGLRLSYNSSTAGIRIDTNNNVGINKTPAGYGDTKLEVNGNVSGTRFLSGGTITNGSYAFEAYGSSFVSSSLKLKRQGSGENEDAGILFQKGNACSTGDHCGGIYFQGTSSLNYAIIRGTCAGSSKGQLNIHIAGQQNTITSTSNDTPIFQLGELGLALGATPNDAYKLYVNGTSYFSQRILADDDIDFQTAGDYITFYGDSSRNHAITSRNSSGNAADDLRINSYGALYVNLDSNNNNSSGANFFVGRHGGTGTISDWLLRLDGETGQLSLFNYGGSGFTGTVAKYLAVDSSGNVIQADGTSSGSGTVNETHAAGTEHEVAVHLGSSTVGEGHKLIYNSTSGLTVNSTSSETDSTYALYVSGGIKNSTGGLYVTGDGYISSRLGVATSVDTSYGIKVAGYIASYGHTTWSDYRLKDNATLWNTSEAATLVKDVPVYSYRWNDNCEAKSVQEQDRIGFLAHEVSERINKNNLVINEKDGEKYQSVNQTDMIPILWAALQDALKRIEELEAK